jgi:hypothetical protein
MRMTTETRASILKGLQEALTDMKKSLAETGKGVPQDSTPSNRQAPVDSS